MHHFLTNIFKENETSINFDKLIMKTDRLMSALPPSRLRMLACAELKPLLSQKKVTLFLKPDCITRYCDTDAQMLKAFQEKQRKEREGGGFLSSAATLVESSALWRTSYAYANAFTGGLIGNTDDSPLSKSGKKA